MSQPTPSSPSPPSKHSQLPTPPPTNLNSPSSPADLRHVTSIPHMAPPMKDRSVSAASDKSGRGIQPLATTVQHRLGSRSPVSIPSSPTSIHSSSSAIFERDIEHHHHSTPQSTNPHRMPRTKMTEPLEHAVPSVLDSAAALLATTDEAEEQFIDVEAPVAVPMSSMMGVPSTGASAVGMAMVSSRGTSLMGSPSPTGRGSRSPSPTFSLGGGGAVSGSPSGGAGGGVRTSMLLNLPSPIPSTIVPMTVSGASGKPASPPLSVNVGTTSPKRPPIVSGLSSASSVGDVPMPGAFSFSAVPAQRQSQTEAQHPQQQSEQEHDTTEPPQTPIAPPGSYQQQRASDSTASSPTTTTLERPPHPLPITSSNTAATSGTIIHPAPTAASSSRPPRVVSSSHPHRSTSTSTSPTSLPVLLPPSPSAHHASIVSPTGTTATASTSNAHKRLSFISYNDLLTSTPTSTLPLSSLTSPGTTEPPPHLGVVGGVLGGATSPIAVVGSRSPSTSVANSARNSVFLDPCVVSNAGSVGVKEPDSTDGLGVGDDVGGEWEREGLGRGLEERLEEIVGVGVAGVGVTKA